MLGKPSAAYFAAACEALDADPSMTWMVGDDLESDIVGAQGIGMRTVLVRTGKFRPDAVERVAHAARRHRLLDRASARVARGAPVIRVGTDLIEIARIRRSLDRYPRLPRPLLHRGRAGVLRLAREPRRELRRAASRARRRSARRSASASRARSRGRRSRSSAARSRRVRLSGRRRVVGASAHGVQRDRSLDDAFARARAGGRRRDRWLTSSRSTPRTRCAPPRRGTRIRRRRADGARRRAGGARSRCRSIPRRRALDGRLRRRRERRRRPHHGARTSRAQGKRGADRRREGGETDLGEPDVIVDALFGTGFSRRAARDGARR